MRKFLIAMLLLAALLLAPLLALRSENTLIGIAHWGVETFTDFRLELKSPVLRPFQRIASAEEIHLYPKDDSGPPFVSVLGFRGDLKVRDFYVANLRETALHARQVIVYVSDRDTTADPEPVQWLQYIGWLPGRLSIDQMHLITASAKTFIFPLKEVEGIRVEGARVAGDVFSGTAKAQYEGEPLDLEVELSAVRTDGNFAGLDASAAFLAPASGSKVKLDGELRGTKDDFTYDFNLDANYTDIAEFLRGFKGPRRLAGQLQLQARMRGGTDSFILEDARFLLDNMPDYGIEAAGELEYAITGESSIHLVAAGEIASLDDALDWVDLDLGALGTAQGSATVTGTLEHPLVEKFILRSASDSGLIVNIKGHLDTRREQRKHNRMEVDVQGPELAVLAPWTGPLPYETGDFRANATLVGERGSIALDQLVAEFGDRNSLELRVEGSAENVSGVNEAGIAAVAGLELDADIFIPDSHHLGELMDADIPAGFTIEGKTQFSGSGEELRATGGEIRAVSSDIELRLSPRKVTLKTTAEHPLQDLLADVTLEISDTSAISQYVTQTVPVLGPVRGSAQLAMKEGNRYSLQDILLQIDNEQLKLESHGSIENLVPLSNIQLQNRFSGIDINKLLSIYLDDFDYPRTLGELEGSFDLTHSAGNWNLSKLRVATHDKDGALSLSSTGDIKNLATLPSIDLKAHYRIRDPDLLEALTGLHMNPLSGKLTAHAESGTINVQSESRVGDTRLRTTAEIEHNPEGIQHLTLVLDSPRLTMGDLGLQARAQKDTAYRPADRLEKVKPDAQLAELLKRSPRYPTDISVAINGIVGENTNIQSLSIHATGLDKRYTLRRFSVTYDESLAEVRGIIDLNPDPPFVSLAGEALAIPLNTVGQDIGLETDISGYLTLRGGLAAQGRNTTELTQTLDGSLALALEDAVIEGAAYDVLATDLLTWVYSGAAAEDSTKIDCTMGKFELRDGVANSDSLYIETEKMVATGTASLDLPRQKMDVKITPLSKFRSLQVPSSIRLKGDFSKPRAVISPVTAAADAYAEFITLVPRLTMKLFGVRSGKKRKQRPCEPVRQD